MHQFLILFFKFRDFSFLEDKEVKLAAQQTFKSHAVKLLKEINLDDDTSEAPSSKRSKTCSKELYEIFYGKHAVTSCDETLCASKKEKLGDSVTVTRNA